MPYYHAYMNKPGNWNYNSLKTLFDHARENHLEIRTWMNSESNLLLFVIKDPDTSQYSGLELYKKMIGKFEGYGLACQEEFESWGTPVNTEDANYFVCLYGSF